MAFLQRLQKTGFILSTGLIIMLSAYDISQAQTVSRYNRNNGNNDDKIEQLLDKISDTSQATFNVANNVTTTVIDKAQQLVGNALNLLGVPYRYGGNTVEQGLDCSGFVKLVFSKTIGLVLPRRAEEMARVGQTVEQGDLQAGDLVFFNTMQRPYSHVGIYIGEGSFVHSPSAGKTIRVDKMNSSYWGKRFEVAKRVTQLGGGNYQPTDLNALNYTKVNTTKVNTNINTNVNTNSITWKRSNKNQSINTHVNDIDIDNKDDNIINNNNNNNNNNDNINNSSSSNQPNHIDMIASYHSEDSPSVRLQRYKTYSNVSAMNNE